MTGEADIGIRSKRDFASLLDELLVESGKAEDISARPSIPFDYLAVADELHSGRIRLSSEALAAEYGEAGADMASEFAALLDQAKLALAGEKPAEEKLPAIDPESIALELNLDQATTPADFSCIRRSFAFSNHPDRVAPHLRSRAMIRMQIANMLIDDAKRRTSTKNHR